MNNAALLQAFAGALRSGGIRVVDLTQTLSPDRPQIALPPEMGQCWPFRIEEVSSYATAGGPAVAVPGKFGDARVAAAVVVVGRSRLAKG